ncbi:MAG: hypothetical protein R3C69_05075 [Geminicoccaceae bacterium]
MLVTLDSLETGSDRSCDLAIVGGGAAGIALALGLGGAGFSIVLAEAGDEEFEPWHQSFCAGSSIGDLPLDPEVTRLRQLGGSTNHWGGRSRPLDAEALAARPSARPARLAARGGRAAAPPRCRLSAAGDRMAGRRSLEAPAESDTAAQALGGPTLTPATVALQPADPDGRTLGCRPCRHGRADPAARCRPGGYRARPVARPGRPGSTSGAARARRSVSGRRSPCWPWAASRNARLLLACNRQLETGIGNQHDQVGRHFMGHPIFRAAAAIAGRWRPSAGPAARPGTPQEGHIEGLLHLNRAGQEALGTTAVDAAFYSDGQFGPPGFRAARRLQRKLGHGQPRMPPCSRMAGRCSATFPASVRRCW